MLKSRLKIWQSQGGIIKLWEEIQGLPAHSAISNSPSISTTRTLHWARLGRLGNAIIKAMSSSGVADPEDELVQAEILKRHPKGPVLLDADLPDLTPVITVTDHLVLKALMAFPKGSNPGGFQLRAQHLLDAVSGFTAPVSQDCLHQLTCLVNFLLSGKAPCLVAPWLCGAPITALHKKNGGVCPIAVCETIRRLVSRVCCLSVRDDLPDLFVKLEWESKVGWKQLSTLFDIIFTIIRTTLTCVPLSLTCTMLSMKLNVPVFFVNLNAASLGYTSGYDDVINIHLTSN